MIDDERMERICSNIFSLNCYNFKAKEFNNFDIMTGKRVTEEEKYFMKMLLKLSETSMGESVLCALNENVKVSLISDPAGKGKDCGWRANGVIAITDLDADFKYNVTTLLHELMHELQCQSGSFEKGIIATQDRFMINKMAEAEARLNTAMCAVQLLLKEPQEERKKFIGALDAQTVKDVNAAWQYEGKDVREHMLRSFYNDEVWNFAYNEQALRIANKRYNLGRQCFEYGRDAREVMGGGFRATELIKKRRLSF